MRQYALPAPQVSAEKKTSIYESHAASLSRQFSPIRPPAAP